MITFACSQHVLDWNQQAFSVKHQVVNILGFMSHIAFVLIMQLRPIIQKQL